MENPKCQDKETVSAIPAGIGSKAAEICDMHRTIRTLSRQRLIW